MTTRIVEVAALDADGAIYNGCYYANLYALARRYGRRLIELAAKPYHSKKELQEIKKLSFSMKHNLTFQLLEMTDWEKERSKLIDMLNSETVEPSEEGVGFPFARFSRKFIVTLKKMDISVYHYLLFQTNKPLFEALKARMARADNSFVAIASARQTKWYDDKAIQLYGTGSIFEDIFLIRDICCSLLPGKDIRVFRGTLGDAYRSAPFGTCLNEMVSGTGAFEAIYEDTTKQSLHYFLTHSMMSVLRRMYPGTFFNVHYAYWDDLGELLQENYDFYSKVPHILPKNCNMSFERYNGAHTPCYRQPVSGTGEVDSRLGVSFRILSNLFGIRNGPDQGISAVHMQQKIVKLFLHEREKGLSSIFSSPQIRFLGELRGNKRQYDHSISNGTASEEVRDHKRLRC